MAWIILSACALLALAAIAFTLWTTWDAGD